MSDVTEGRTCFVCLKVNFGVLHWSHSCMICKKSVCRHCSMVLRLASEDCEKLTVSDIIPQLSPPTPTPTNLPSPSPTNFLR